MTPPKKTESKTDKSVFIQNKYAWKDQCNTENYTNLYK